MGKIDLPVDILEEGEAGWLADVLEDQVWGEGEDDVGQVGAHHKLARHAVYRQQRRHFIHNCSRFQIRAILGDWRMKIAKIHIL